MFICMKEIVQFKEDIKKLSKKHHQTLVIQLEILYANQLLMPLELLDITMQVL
jgi:hypothetical protein